MGRLRSLVTLGDEFNVGHVLQLGLDWTHWLVGVSWEVNPGEASVCARLGPLYLSAWWFRRGRTGRR